MNDIRFGSVGCSNWLNISPILPKYAAELPRIIFFTVLKQFFLIGWLDQSGKLKNTGYSKGTASFHWESDLLAGWEHLFLQSRSWRIDIVRKIKPLLCGNDQTCGNFLPGGLWRATSSPVKPVWVLDLQGEIMQDTTSKWRLSHQSIREQLLHSPSAKKPEVAVNEVSPTSATAADLAAQAQAMLPVTTDKEFPSQKQSHF